MLTSYLCSGCDSAIRNLKSTNMWHNAHNTGDNASVKNLYKEVLYTLQQYSNLSCSSCISATADRERSVSY